MHGAMRSMSSSTRQASSTGTGTVKEFSNCTTDLLRGADLRSDATRAAGPGTVHTLGWSLLPASPGRHAAGDRGYPHAMAVDRRGRTTSIGTILVVIWLVIGVIAAAQRGY